MVIQEFVTNEYDNCNPLKSRYKPHVLYKVQSSAVGLLHSTGHITPVLDCLFWLYIVYRVQFKVCILVLKPLHVIELTSLGNQLSYSDPVRQLCSSETIQM